MKYTVQVQQKTIRTRTVDVVVDADNIEDAQILARYKARDTSSYMWDQLPDVEHPPVTMLAQRVPDSAEVEP